MRQTLSRFVGPVYVQRMNAKREPRTEGAEPASQPGPKRPDGQDGEPDAFPISAEHRVERAAGDMRRGAPVLVRARAAGQSVVAVAAETVNAATLAGLAARFGAGHLLLTHARAATLKIRLYTPEIVRIALPPGAGVEEIRALADPTRDLGHPLQGPFAASRDALPEAAPASVRLAKLAELLPAAVVFPVADALREGLVLEGLVLEGVSAVDAADIAAFQERAAQTLQMVTRARVPLEGAPEAELAAFRPADGGQEHYAVLIGAKDGVALAPPGPVLTRLH